MSGSVTMPQNLFYWSYTYTFKPDFVTIYSEYLTQGKSCYFYPRRVTVYISRGLRRGSQVLFRLVQGCCQWIMIVCFMAFDSVNNITHVFEHIRIPGPNFGQSLCLKSSELLLSNSSHASLYFSKLRVVGNAIVVKKSIPEIKQVAFLKNMVF